MKAVLVISDRDNVATALQPLQAGQTVDAGGDAVTVIEPIASGHKVALRRINVGEPVIKYGSPIGTATVVIEPGAHVHTQNVASRPRPRRPRPPQRRSAAAAGRAPRRPFHQEQRGPVTCRQPIIPSARASSGTVALTAVSGRATTSSSSRP
jgi:altronate hydrolase